MSSDTPISFAPGARFGPYEVITLVGAGGMGQVYKARDTRLGRFVGLKVLRDDFARDPERRKRFEREAHAVSSLNHPRICTLYDVGRDKGHEFLVMEFLEGETLEMRLSRGPLPVELALKHAIDIAEALDHAHRLGFTHRDLKPANVMLTRGGAKLLDFGLAKLGSAAAEATGALERGLERLERHREKEQAVNAAPTHATALTHAGAILGTFGYMSPERLQGAEADVRSDIFAFGATLYEMVTGRRAFEGSTTAAVIGAVFAGNPAPIDGSSGVPPLLDPIVQRCMAKDPEERWQTVRDLLVALRWIAAGSLTAKAGIQQRANPAAVLALVVGLLLAGVAGGYFLSSAATSRNAAPVSARWDVAIPSDRSFDAELFPSIAVSPDGTHIVFRAQANGTSQLFIRGSDQFEARAIEKSEGGHTPFFSPDGQWIGFLANGRVYKSPVAGGTPTIVCEAPSLSPGSPGAAWGPDNTIVFAAGAAGLMQVPAAGGKPARLTIPDVARGEITHIGPQFLPGGEQLLFTIRTAEEGWRIAVLSMKTHTWEWLPPAGEIAGATYVVSSGHLVYAQAGSLYAVPLDLARRIFTGPPLPVLNDVYTKVVSDAIVAQFSISNNGVLSYVSGHAPEWELVRVNAAGERQPLGNLRRSFRYPRLSPDGSRLAVTVEEERADIYVVDTDRAILRKITTTGTNTLPVWTRDGQRVVYASRRQGSRSYDIYSSPADASTEPTMLLARDGSQLPSGWSPRENKLAFYELGNETARDIWVWSGDGSTSPVLASTANERGATFSPDGNWLAYVSNESGRDEVYVRRYPGTGAGEVVSTDGGSEPVWSPTSNELFYWNHDQLLAVTIQAEPRLNIGATRVLFRGAFVRTPPETGQPNYSVFPDGKSFVMVHRIETAAAHLHVLQNWFTALSPGR